MGKQIANSTLWAVLALGLCVDAQACECRVQDAAVTFKDSTHVILGEVVRIETLATGGRSNAATIEYVAVLKAVETYKGEPGVEVRVSFSINLTSISSCGVSMRVGERYVIFEKERTPMIYDDRCQPRIRVAAKRMLDYLKKLP